MMHPATELGRAGSMGFGVFATEFIPRGTIVYVRDALEHVIGPEEFRAMPAVLRHSVDTYSYIDRDGFRVLSWDMAKYVNHRCDCNSLSTGWGFEVTVRDVLPGEEITDDYGMFNLESPLALSCGCPQCRRFVMPDDFDRCTPAWDAQVRMVLPAIPAVAQPLWELLEDEVQREVEACAVGSGSYRSVAELRRIAV